MEVEIDLVDLLMFSMSLDKEKAKDFKYVLRKYLKVYPDGKRKH